MDCGGGGGTYLWYTVVCMWFLRRFKKVLVVDDDRALRQALVEKLRHEGFPVVAVESGADVLKTVVGEKPDAVLLDLMLPGRDGMSLLTDLRGQDVGYTKPVIILTNLSGRGGLAADAAQLNAQYFDKASTKIQDVVSAVVECV